MSYQKKRQKQTRQRRGRKAALFGLAGCAVLGAAAAPYALADNETPNPPVETSQRGRGGGGHHMRWLDQLDLTNEQVESIQAIRDRYQPQMEAQRQQMWEQRQSMHGLMGSNASESELRQQHQRMQELRDEMSELHFNSMMEIRNVLTADQRAQVSEWMEERGGRGMGPGGGRGMGPGGGRGMGPGGGRGMGPGGGGTR